LKQIEGHVFYLAFGYFISYLPNALLARALAPPGSAQLVAVGFVVGAVVALSYRSRPLTAELCRQADVIYGMTADVIYGMTAEHRATVLALGPDVADRTRCPAERDIVEPSAVSLIQQAMGKRLAEQFL
jgi:hypothetical protein